MELIKLRAVPVSITPRLKVLERRRLRFLRRGIKPEGLPYLIDAGARRAKAIVLAALLTLSTLRGVAGVGVNAPALAYAPTSGGCSSIHLSRAAICLFDKNSPFGKLASGRGLRHSTKEQTNCPPTKVL